MLCFTHICSEEYFFLYGKKHLLMLLKKKKKKGFEDLITNKCLYICDMPTTTLE